MLSLEQDELQEDVDQLEVRLGELEVTKGSAGHKVKQTTVGAASRNGELITDSEYIEQITAISLAPYDINGAATKPVAVGDVVEFDMGNGKVARYTVTDADSANAMTVAYNNGTGLIAVDQFIDIYIYPQNKAGASATTWTSRMSSVAAIRRQNHWKVCYWQASQQRRWLLY